MYRERDSQTHTKKPVASQQDKPAKLCAHAHTYIHKQQTHKQTNTHVNTTTKSARPHTNKSNTHRTNTHVQSVIVTHKRARERGERVFGTEGERGNEIVRHACAGANTSERDRERGGTTGARERERRERESGEREETGSNVPTAGEEGEGDEGAGGLLPASP